MGGAGYLSQTPFSEFAHVYDSFERVKSLGEHLREALTSVPKISNSLGELVTRIIRRIGRMLLRYGILFIVLVAIFTLVGLVMKRVDIFARDIGLSTVLGLVCYRETERNLKNKSEIEKLNSAAATSLVTLLPALLTLAPFPMARISHLVAYSTGAAMTTASITFGLSATELSTLVKDRAIRVKDLCGEVTINFYGQLHYSVQCTKSQQNVSDCRGYTHNQ